MILLTNSTRASVKGYLAVAAMKHRGFRTWWIRSHFKVCCLVAPSRSRCEGMFSTHRVALLPDDQARQEQLDLDRIYNHLKQLQQLRNLEASMSLTHWSDLVNALQASTSRFHRFSVESEVREQSHRMNTAKPRCCWDFFFPRVAIPLYAVAE